jgi:hypothetical protein
MELGDGMLEAVRFSVTAPNERFEARLADDLTLLLRDLHASSQLLPLRRRGLLSALSTHP